MHAALSLAWLQPQQMVSVGICRLDSCPSLSPGAMHHLEQVASVCILCFVQLSLLLRSSAWEADGHFENMQIRLLPLSPLACPVT